MDKNLVALMYGFCVGVVTMAGAWTAFTVDPIVGGIIWAGGFTAYILGCFRVTRLFSTATRRGVN